ncbi:trichoplein keratin filament-binding protein isoform X3 [Gallus gallus]|uniref:Trichoplein keratin filament-binding protein n=1 Tax=Gallus gallus TaxID=9031 RepID=A0A8V0ZLY5_CHICK|nr:trichoplein keratin filament-binding protein isoform X3 [Gallus gallus]XP_040540655.1 trichoplein keratin filament-binding protein isoform X3 [Gallus gallus]|eukprot:XP_015130990.1 trichoplein keratin filament-binding protein isoform X3 [Gallus gallus]
MALWRATRGRAFERRREQEARSRLQWESYSRSFARAAICCSAQARWSAPRGPRSPSSGRREAAERLGQRRERLRELLSAERDALEAELQPGRGTEPAGMRERCAELRAAREGRRRQVESELHTKSVAESWGEQLKQKQQQEAMEREERELYENEYEIAQREALERIRQEEEKRQLEDKKQAEMLLQQIEELKLREAEATKLKKEQENLLKQQWELQSLEEERKQMEEHRKKTELGRFLMHQCDAQLKRRAQQIQEELETDRQILLALLEKEGEDQRRQSERRERAVADAAWMRRVIEEQLQLEKEREAELQIIFREEARKVWEKREEQWKKERMARDRLMNEVLAGRQLQIQAKMELNRQAQEESIKHREQLIKELEEAKELTRQEREKEKELKTARRQELEAQLTERRLQEQEKQERQREEEEEERLNKQRCAELVQQEARSMAEQGYCSR